ncbi:MAG: hypothetical protein GX237_11155 [Clostridiales bacterium]|nr:hypothetical protein [Clostridiales bacterium]
MMDKIKNKKALKVLIAILVLIFIYNLFNVKNIHFEKMDDIIFYSSLPDGTENLYGLTGSGKIYCFNYKKGKVEVVVEESDIIYFGGRERSLIIYSDGSIYIDETGGLEGNYIGEIEGAISGDASAYHAAIITAKGEVYICGKNSSENSNILGSGNRYELDEFQLIELSEKVVKVDCGLFNTLLLTENGGLYWSGDLMDKYTYTFKKHEESEDIIDIHSNDYTSFVLHKDGDVTGFGSGSDFCFLAVDTHGFNNIISFSVSANNAIGINNKGELFYCGDDIYNTNGLNNILYPQKLKGIRKAKEVYCSDMNAYVIQKNKITCIPLDKENRLKKFINYYNIFAPHYKG